MVTYYTALGRMITREENNTRIPVVIIEDSKYHLTVDELIVWGTLHWSFLDKTSAEKEYSRRKAKNRLFNDVSFEQTLNRLVNRGLIVSGNDYLAADALYNLIGTLKIKHVRFSLTEKIKSIAYLYFSKGLTFRECYNAYFRTEFTPDEKNVLRLSKYIGLSASEIVKCVENNIREIKTEDDVMDKLYDDEESTFETIATYSRFSALKSDVVKAVVNLYLKKIIIFEN